MNTTLPPSRDLPPGRHAEIRAAVARAVERPRRRWVFPLVTAGAALGLVLWLVPWDRPDAITISDQPPASTTASSTPGLVGLTEEQAQAIADGCAEGVQTSGKFTLHQYLVDEAGQLALVYGDHESLVCEVDGPTMKYNSSYGGLSAMTPPLAIDHIGSSGGGDAPNGKPEYAGMRGFDVVAGRISPEVAKVTVTIGADTMEASLANGTFLARFVRPSDWVIPEAERPTSVVAYDKNGVEVGAFP